MTPDLKALREVAEKGPNAELREWLALLHTQVQTYGHVSISEVSSKKIERAISILDERDRLEAERDGLKAALRPFANYATLKEFVWFEHDDGDDDEANDAFTVGDYRAAKAALSQPVGGRENAQTINTDAANYEGAMADLDSLLTAVIRRLNGEADMAGLAEFITLNYPKRAAEIRCEQPDLAVGEAAALAGPRPIETAPDNTSHMNKVLLFWRTRGWDTGWWDVDEEFADRPKSWRSPECGWRCDGDQCIPVNQDDVTHWMPLPANPAKEGE